MTTLIFGIGIGLFILITIWLLAGIIFSISSKTDKKFGFIAITIATLITLILICLPKNSEHPNIKEEKLYDHYFILRISLVILLAASSIIAGIGYVNYALMETKKPQRITTWVY